MALRSMIAVLTLILVSTTHGKEAVLFKESEVLHLKIVADFSTLHRKPITRQKTIPTGKNDPNIPLLTIATPDSKQASSSFRVQLQLRGNSSLEECDFPKLKLKFLDKTNLTGSIFEGLSGFKIGTHCRDNPMTLPTPKGRLANQTSPMRENFVYQLLHILEIPAQKTRLAQIEYVDSGNNGKSLIRYALLIESMSTTAKRMNGKEIEFRHQSEVPTELEDEGSAGEPRIFKSAQAERAEMSLLARALLFQALINNYDWGIRIFDDEQDIFDSYANLKTIEVEERRLILPTDFDLSTAVTGFVDHYAQAIFADPKLLLNEASRNMIARIKAGFTEQIRRSEIAYFASRRLDIFNALSTSRLDPESQQNFSRHFEAFFQELERETLAP